MMASGRRPVFNQRKRLVEYLVHLSGEAGRSTFGAMLLRMAAFARGSTPCLLCGGDRRTQRPGCGFVVGDQAELERWKRAKRQRRRAATKPLSDAARVFCEATGVDVEAPITESLPPRADTVCPRCGGFGFVVRQSKVRPRGPITARPKGSSVPTQCGGYVLDEDSVRLCAEVARALRAVYSRDPEAEQTIRVYCQHGESLVPLWLCTAPARMLLRRSPMGRDALARYDLDAALRVLDNERAAQETAPDPQRAMLLADADRAALAMLERAASLWNALVPSEDEQHERDFRKAVGL